MTRCESFATRADSAVSDRADPLAAGERREFFVSYTQADRAWAAWIASTLEDAGHPVYYQEWDLRPGADFVREMRKAAERSARAPAVVSPD